MTYRQADEKTLPYSELKPERFAASLSELVDGVRRIDLAPLPDELGLPVRSSRANVGFARFKGWP